MAVILITGATDGIGRATAERLVGEGHRIIVHGRSAEKVDATVAALGAGAEGILADLSDLGAVAAMARRVAAMDSPPQVLLNNAGVFKLADPVGPRGIDMRFLVNAVAPYVLTRALPRLARVINVSSAAQAPVDLDALTGGAPLADMAAYAQSKLALLQWTAALRDADGPLMVGVNPGSMLGTKMVREGFGAEGADISIGARCLAWLATAPGEELTGLYYDNDRGSFAPAHPEATDPERIAALMAVLERISP